GARTEGEEHPPHEPLVQDGAGEHEHGWVVRILGHSTEKAQHPTADPLGGSAVGSAQPPLPPPVCGAARHGMGVPPAPAGAPRQGLGAPPLPAAPPAPPASSPPAPPLAAGSPSITAVPPQA